MPVNLSEIASSYWFLWMPLLFGVVGWFEWKCTSDNKGLIRTSSLVGLSLICNAFVFWLALTNAVAMVMLLHLFIPPID